MSVISWWLWIGTCLPACLLSYLAVLVVRRSANSLGLMDRPGHRKIHSVPIPLGGGLGIWLGVVGTFAIGSLIVFNLDATSSWIPASLESQWGGLRKQASQLWILLLGGTCLMILGLMDDRKGLPWQIRLAVEVMIASAVVYWQGLQLTAFIELPCSLASSAFFGS